jgi:hypothetical protein
MEPARIHPTRRTVAGAAAVVVLFLLLATNVAVLVMGRQTQREAEHLTATVADCQNETGTCYARSQQRITELIRQLNASNLYLVQCSKVTNTDDELAACVEQRLRDGGVPVLPAPARPTPAPSAAEPTPSAAQDDDETP